VVNHAHSQEAAGERPKGMIPRGVSTHYAPELGESLRAIAGDATRHDFGARARIPTLRRIGMAAKRELIEPHNFDGNADGIG